MKTKIFLYSIFLLLMITDFPLHAQDSTPLPTARPEGTLDTSRREGLRGGSAGGRSAISSTLGADLVSRYIWRGQDLGNVCVQPTLGIAWKGLSLSAWGSVDVTDFNNAKELDLTLEYTISGFSVGITDYWFGEGRYFLYKNDQTTHVFEAAVGYDFGFLAAKWYTNFAGADGVNKDGKRAYSSYFELSAPFRLATLDWSAAIGFVPYATSFYDVERFSVTNISLRATKDFVIKEKYHLPVFAELSANPRSEKMYLLCGVSFSM